MGASARRGCGISKERRHWPRLPLAIPLFVRGVERSGKEFLDFTVAFNVSAGGALVAIRRAIPRTTQLSLEIPSAPWLRLMVPPQAVRSLKARVVRLARHDTYNLCAVQFNRPLT